MRFNETAAVPPHIFELWVKSGTCATRSYFFPSSWFVVTTRQFRPILAPLTSIHTIPMQFEDSTGGLWVEEQDAEGYVYYVNSNTLASPLCAANLLTSFLCGTIEQVLRTAYNSSDNARWPDTLCIGIRVSGRTCGRDKSYTHMLLIPNPSLGG